MIRKFRIEDLDNIMNIWLETNIRAHDFICKDYWQGNHEMVKEMLPKAEIFLYDDNNTIKGFIGLMDNYIAGIFVNTNNQSKGIGKKLLDYVKMNHTELSLQVYNRNVRAVQFYLREGFLVTKEQIDENTGEVELVMNWTK
ncbi:MAG: N-acetyltransferase [Tissierellaceae bacterium]|nr:N-acetyltransferase [Tissierellaceae bacterium]